jgi:hypothetical protein
MVFPIIFLLMYGLQAKKVVFPKRENSQCFCGENKALKTTIHLYQREREREREREQIPSQEWAA